MATKLDSNFVSAMRETHDDAKGGFETLVSEVKRLEAYCEELEKRLTPELIQEASAAASKIETN